MFQSTCLIRRVSPSPSLSSHPLPPLNPLLFLVILNRVKSDRFSHSSPRSLRLLFSSQIQSFLCPSIPQHSKHTNADEALGGGGGTQHATRARPHAFGGATKEPYRGKFAPIPASSRHSQPSQAHCLLGSCQHRPILLSFHRRSIGGANQISRGEEIGEGLAPICGPSSFFPPLSCSFIYTLLYTHIQRYTPMRGTRKRVALGDGGLGERRMLAGKGPDPSPGSNAPLTLPLMCRREQPNNNPQSILGDPWTPARAFMGRACVHEPWDLLQEDKGKSFFPLCFHLPTN